MDLPRCHASLLQTPFAAYGIQIHQMGHPSKSTPVHYLRPSPPRPVGVRGVRQLAIQHRHDVNEESQALTDLKLLDVSQVPLRFITKHKRGQLLVWDGSSSEVIGSCSHGRNVMVQHCLMNEEDIFTTVEGIPGMDSENNYNVYRWSAQNLSLVDTMPLPRKVEGMALLGRDTLITATDMSIDFWQYRLFREQGIAPFRTIDSRHLGIPNKLELIGDAFLFVAGSRKPLVVYSLQTGQLLAQSAQDANASSTSLRVIQNKKNDNDMVVLTGSSEGFVTSWYISLSMLKGATTPHVLTSSDRQKLHPANVSDLVADADIILSTSEYSGPVVMHRRDKIITSISKTPCRALMMDSDNKRFIIGDDMGFISVYSYATYVANCKKIDCLLRCRPHQGAITGVYLQLGAGSMWERVLTCSIEGSIATLDFTEDKPLLTLPAQTSGIRLNNVVAATDDCVAVLDMDMEQVYFFTEQFETHLDYPVLMLQGEGISMIQWVDNATLMGVAKNSREVKFFSLAMDCDMEPIWKNKFTWAFPEMLGHSATVPVSLHVCNDDRTILVCGAVRKETETQQSGMFSLICFTKTTVTTIHTEVIDFVPCGGRVFLLPSAPCFHCVIQEENGSSAVYMICTKKKGLLKAVPLTSPFTVNTKLATPQLEGFLVDKSTTLQLNYIDNGVVNCVSIESAQATATPSSGPFMEGAAISTSRVTGLCVVNAGRVKGVVLREGANAVEVVMQDGTTEFLLTAEGDVAPVRPPSRWIPNSFPSPQGDPLPVCTAISFHAEGRYVAASYVDGLLQIFDVFENRLISRWYTPYVGGGTQLLAFLNGVMVTSGDQRYISIYLIPRRFVYDHENDKL